MNKLIYILTFISLVACKEDSQIEPNAINDEETFLIIPEGFPEMEFPSNNEFTDERWELGKKLFYEKRLSINNSLSCGSCHKPALAFADNVALSLGVFNRAGTRNAPTLANVGYQPYLLREGSISTLEMQVLVPIQEHNEFNHNIVNIIDELKQDSSYAAESLEAYGRPFDGFVLSRAISVFQRSIISGNSAFDQYLYQGNTAALNSVERQGMELFFSNRAGCSSCHGGFNFTSYSFENNGLDLEYVDLGRFRFTNDSIDLAKFKVPSLRNVGLTAPYMHNGSINSLREVIDHYNSGGKNHQNKSELVKPLNLSEAEKNALVAFLNSLNDYEFVNDSRWNP